ncbi:MAG: glycerophosphodiester phosphodiesterase [Bavariicoccus seileri]|uniref:glycerophosphodiester phosphodiesterase n=1 Tax=Bavariicoccus seileri TaxID=549685 RepID=UPI0003B337DA|nr:glycerophosphodiester phosphodiesterase [Bavariicoccus seileri]
MTLLTAHSGSDELPENSIKFASFFRNKPAVDAIEVDVRYDDLEHKLVLHHEPLEKDRLYTSLASIFKCIKNSHLLINCDLKETGLEDEVFWLADQYGIKHRVLLSGAVNPLFLKRHANHILMNLENGIDIDRLTGVLNEQVLVVALETLAQKGATLINLNENWLTPTIQERGEELGLLFSVWTVNDYKKIARYRKQRVFNITSKKAWGFITREVGISS